METSISIDGWHIDASSHRISRGGVENKLEPRSMELLIYLAERPDQVVTRQEIEENVWKGRIVGYDAVSGSIAKIRKAFGDTSKNHRIIETIPKAGYRLIAPVQAGTDEEDISSGDPPRKHDPGKRRPITGPLLALAIVIVVISLVVIGDFSLNPRDSKIKSTAETEGLHFDPDKPSLAILPFKNMSNDPGQSVFSDGLTDDLITDLSNIDGLRVTPRHSSFLYETKKIPPLDVARELRVRYIVQGSVRRSFDDIRVNVQLVDTQNNQEIWAARFDDNIESIFKLQDQIINQILIKIKLHPSDKRRSKRRTTNLEAYDFFLRAEHRRLNRSGSTRGVKTLEFYRRAIELDPLFIAAYTGLARAALINWQLDASQVMPSAASKKLVYKTAGKALELDPENAEALAILGLLQAISGEHDAGIASVSRAVAIDPANPQLKADLAVVLSYGGYHGEALESINTAIDWHTTPPSIYFGERSQIYFFLGQFENALKDAEIAYGLRQFSDFSLFIHGALNDRESARRYKKARLDTIPWENQQYYWVMFAYYRRPQDIQLIVDSANKAGMPRFAYGFDPGESKPLDNIAISGLTSKGLWRGFNHNGGEFFQQFAPGNSVAVRSADTMMSGSYHIENNKLCITVPSVLLDLPDCGYIYPEEDNYSYSWVTVGDVYRFTVGP